MFILFILHLIVLLSAGSTWDENTNTFDHVAWVQRRYDMVEVTTHTQCLLRRIFR